MQRYGKELPVPPPPQRYGKELAVPPPPNRRRKPPARQSSQHLSGDVAFTSQDYEDSRQQNLNSVEEADYEESSAPHIPNRSRRPSRRMHQQSRQQAEDTATKGLARPVSFRGRKDSSSDEEWGGSDDDDDNSDNDQQYAPTQHVQRLVVSESEEEEWNDDDDDDDEQQQQSKKSLHKWAST